MENQKQQLFDFCTAFVKGRIDRIQDLIEEMQSALATETKSSAGDKHETGRAMIQLEREKLGQQLSEAEKMQSVLARIRISQEPTSVILGSWVKTSKADYYLAVSAGECKQTAIAVYCISAATPIGRLLLGKSAGDQVVFNGESIRILAVV